MSKALVHEAIEIEGPITELNKPIDHYTESNLSNILLKIDRYSTLGAREAYAAGKRSSIYSAAFRAFLVFFQNYFLRLGILDGSQGLTLSITDSMNKFCKYAKLAELGKEMKGASR